MSASSCEQQSRTWGKAFPFAMVNGRLEGIDHLNYAHPMSVRINLDLDILRTLSVAQELGSLAQAAEQLGRTPSAISLQMKRLQDDIGIVLFRKHGRNLAVTEAGVVVLDYALNADGTEMDRTLRPGSISRDQIIRGVASASSRSLLFTHFDVRINRNSTQPRGARYRGKDCFDRSLSTSASFRTSSHLN
jgi:hypothetical protein